MTVAIYIRVSTAEQVEEGYSIAAQKERLTAYCKAQAWDNYKFYVDEGVSAKDTKRPELHRLFEDMRNGQVNMILVYRLDRFTRKVIDLHRMLEEMKKCDCAFKSATEPYDTSTAMGRMFITLVAALAEWETENLSERVKLALEEKVSNGERVGGIPYPFDLGHNEKLVMNDRRTRVTLDIIDKFKTGMSTERIADFLTKTNNDKAKWRANTVIRILRNPALYGATRWNDSVYEDTHQGIISKDEFATIQKMMQQRTKHRRREVKSVYLFQGAISCPSCGRPLSVNRFFRKMADGSDKQYHIYRCQPCEKEKKFNRHFNENKILDALYDYMRNFQIDDIDYQEEQKESIYADQLKQIERKREKYQKAWASDLMSDEEFKRLMDDTRDVYEDLKEKVAQSEPEQKVDPDALKNIVFSFNETFQKLTQEEKRTFVSTFIQKIHIKVDPNLPQRADKSERGRYSVSITDIDFY